MSQHEREAVVQEALSWIGTPYVLGGRVKGAGADCATLIAEVLIACGLVEREDGGVYSHDWFHHTEQDRYMLRVLRHAVKTMDAIAYPSQAIAPGNIVLTRAARSKIYNHGAIVIRWPMVVHAVQPQVAEIDASRHRMWQFQQIAVFDPFAKAAEAA
jgi:cell wall-associated NlpC family hydrolase